MADKITQDSFLSVLFNGRSRDELTEVGRGSGVLLEQYKQYVEMADRVSARRLTTNSFFLTLNSAIIALGGYNALRIGQPAPASLAVAASLAGVTLCLVWFRLVKSYRDLNSAKFRVIHEIEKLLPLSPYDAEWQAVGRGTQPARYLPFTNLELYVPWVFAMLHVAAFLGPLV
jgi:hypothetical protein